MADLSLPLPLPRTALRSASEAGIRPGPRGHIRHVIDGLGHGGAERLLAATLPRLAAQGFSVDVVSLQDRDGSTMRAPLEAAGIPVRQIEVTKLRNLRQVARFLRAMQADRPALLHAHLEFSTLLGAAAGRLLHLPTVTTLHTLEAPGLASRRDLRRWLMYRAMALGMDRVLCLTAANASAVRAGGLARAPIEVLPNGVEMALFDAPPATGRTALRAALSIPPGAPLVLTVCVLRPLKGVDRLLKAFSAVLAQLPDAHLLVVGDGPERAALETLARNLGLGPRLRFTGHRADVADLMRAADLFVLPTLFDAQPTVVMEAMAARLPVVASRTGGIPDMVDDRSGLLVPRDDPAALAAAIAALLADPARARALGEAGRARAEAEFSIDRQISRLGALYDRLIAAREVRP
ncbi:glycosyltransferase [Solirhodobacter olei]|uniref:glycosyltransferase n=1 Tax=Solirhodobacter olei TaxID=2493082 RepID=UPI000FD7710A|nr:glycosyltransferase [Solirhodobacter olei]